MKIEMGESLAISWLKHIKKCTIVQTNWKPSFEWEERDDEFVDQVMQNAHDYFSEVGYPVFPYERGNDRVDYYKVLMQTECDGIGVRVGRDRAVDEYFAIESAFHSDGLHYGRSAQDTATKVAEKMIRIAMALYYFMGVKRAHIYFATPKITNSFFGPVLDAFSRVSSFFQENQFVRRDVRFEFELLVNQPEGALGDFGRRFDDVVLSPIKKLLPIIDDTAELFVRAVSMDKMCMAHCDVSGSNLRRALKTLQIKFEEFLRRCETFTGISQMIEGLHDNDGNRRKAIIDCVSEMKWDELHLVRKLNKRDIDRLARNEVVVNEDAYNRPDLDVNGAAGGGDNEAENQVETELILTPRGRREFAEALCRAHRARRVRHYADGRDVVDIWNTRLNESARVLPNIYGSSYWRMRHETGLLRVEIAVIE